MSIPKSIQFYRASVTNLWAWVYLHVNPVELLEQMSVDEIAPCDGVVWRQLRSNHPGRSGVRSQQDPLGRSPHRPRGVLSAGRSAFRQATDCQTTVDGYITYS